MNRTLKNILSKLVKERQGDWDTWLPQALLYRIGQLYIARLGLLLISWYLQEKPDFQLT